MLEMGLPVIVRYPERRPIYQLLWCLEYARPHQRRTARISALADFAVQLGSGAPPLAPSVEQVVFIRIKLTSAQGARGRQRRVWRLAEVLAHCIPRETQFFPDLAQAHPSCMKFLYALI